MTYNNTHIYSKVRMCSQYCFQYVMIGPYYLSGRHFTYFDVNLKCNIYVVYDDLILFYKQDLIRIVWC